MFTSIKSDYATFKKIVNKEGNKGFLFIVALLIWATVIGETSQQLYLKKILSLNDILLIMIPLSIIIFFILMKDIFTWEKHEDN